MGLGTHAFSLITTTFLLSTLPACTTCVGSSDQPEPRAQRTAQKRSASNRKREKVKRHTLQVGGTQRRYLVQTPRGNSETELLEVMCIDDLLVLSGQRQQQHLLAQIHALANKR